MNCESPKSLRLTVFELRDYRNLSQLSRIYGPQGIIKHSLSKYDTVLKRVTSLSLVVPLGL